MSISCECCVLSGRLWVQIPLGAWMSISCECCVLSGRLWVRIPLGARMSVSCECCVSSGRGLCYGLSPVQRSPTECGVSECDRESSIMRRPWPTEGCCVMTKKLYYTRTMLCYVRTAICYVTSMLRYVRTHASFMITLLSHCWGFLTGHSPPIGLFGSISPRGGLSCGTTVTTSASNMTTVPNICMNLKQKNIFTGLMFIGPCIILIVD